MWFRLLVLEDSRVALPTNKDEQEEEVAVARVCLPEFHPLASRTGPWGGHSTVSRAAVSHLLSVGIWEGL